MSGNDLVESLSGGELAPYDAGQPLAPMSHDDWANPGVDLLREDRQHAPQTLTMFGTVMPQGTTEADVQRILDDIGARFVQDMGVLRYPANLIGFAAKFYRQQATASPRHVRVNHNFELPTELTNDWLATEFCNRLENIEGTKRQKQQFLTAAITWLARLVKVMQQNTQSPDVGQVTAHGSAPNSSERMLSQLSDADYNKVIAINNKAQAEAMNRIAAKFGEHSSQEVVRLAQAHLDKLTPAERAHFDQFTTVNGVNWVHMMNCAETIEFLYNAAIGANNLPKDGPSINREIAQIEALMREPASRRAYLKDSQMQARLRALYDLQR